MERIKSKIKAVIFDMDGTIIDTEHVWNQATKSVLSKRGFTEFSDQQKEVLKSLSGSGLSNCSEIIKREFVLTDSSETLITEIKEAAHRLFENEVKFIEGFEQFHKKLQQLSIPTSIATNADLSCLTILNKKMNLEQFFGKNLFCISMVNNKAKPDPKIFLHAAEKLNVKPSECVVFEDSIAGFKAAKAAGMKCIAIKNKVNHSSIYTKLDLVQKSINSYHEAEEALIKLISSD
jgi:HAD superfamily hydrolase (TIGR01509 family)